MGLLDWLFEDGEEAEAEESAPEILVLGAELKCIYGSQNSYLFIDSEDIDLNNLPEACVEDCEALYNILPFGTCVMGGPCACRIKSKRNGIIQNRRQRR